MWVPIPANSVVRSRNVDALGLGEWRSLTNCRLKRGDLAQLHNDWSQTLISTQTETIIGVWHLAFEGTDDKVLIVTTDGATNSYLKTGDPDTGSFASIQTITGVVTAAGVAHRGNQYFVGTDQGNYVITDNVSRPMGMSVSATPDSTWVTLSSDAGSTAYALDDYFVYVLTEYDSTNDIESALVINDTGSDEGEWVGGYIRIDAATDQVGIDWSGWSKINTNTSHVRIYKAFVGNYTDPGDTQEGIQACNRLLKYDPLYAYPVGARLIAQVAYATGSYNDTGSGYYGGSFNYPLIKVDDIGGGSIFEWLGFPSNFTLAAVFNDKLVTNDPAESSQILRYSPPQHPEYQPAPYNMYFATEQSDTIVGLRVINNKLIVLLTGSVHRVNYLPTIGSVAALQGRVQEPVAGTVGCVGREAHTKVETEQGEFVVWLSSRGLEMSNGVGWADACPDWTADQISGTASQVVVQNNPKTSRIELYDGTTRWDFYYDPTLLKSGRFRLTGPHTHPVSVRFATANQDRAWTASTTQVYKEQSGVNSTDTVIESGHIYAHHLDRSVPYGFMDLICDGIGLTHSAMSATTCSFTVYGKLKDEDEVDSGPCPIQASHLAYAQTSDVTVEMMGTYMRIKDTLSGTDDWSVGPFTGDFKVDEGGNG